MSIYNYLRKEQKLVVVDPELNEQMLKMIDKQIDTQKMNFEETCDSLFRYSSLDRDLHPRLAQFYLGELIKPKHSFLMTKIGGKISSAIYNKNFVTDEQLLSDPVFYMQCRPFFQVFFKICTLD